MWARGAVRIVQDIECRHLRMRIRVRVTGSGRGLWLQLVERARVAIRTGAGPKLPKKSAARADLLTGWAGLAVGGAQPSRSISPENLY